MHKNDVIAVLSQIVSAAALAADAGFAQQVQALFGTNGKSILAAIGIAGSLAAILIRVLSVPTVDGTATSVIAIPAAAVPVIANDPAQINAVPAKADVPPTQ